MTLFYLYYCETTLYYDHQHWITFELRGIHAYNEMARIVERIHGWKGSRLQFSDLFQQRWECWSMLLKALFDLKTNLDWDCLFALPTVTKFWIELRREFDNLIIEVWWIKLVAAGTVNYVLYLLWPILSPKIVGPAWGH